MSIRNDVREGRQVDVKPLAKEAGVSGALLYRMIKRGELRAIPIGGRFKVPAQAAAPLLGMQVGEAA